MFHEDVFWSPHDADAIAVGEGLCVTERMIPAPSSGTVRARAAVRLHGRGRAARRGPGRRHRPPLGRRPPRAQPVHRVRHGAPRPVGREGADRPAPALAAGLRAARLIRCADRLPPLVPGVRAGHRALPEPGDELHFRNLRVSKLTRSSFSGDVRTGADAVWKELAVVPTDAETIHQRRWLALGVLCLSLLVSASTTRSSTSRCLALVRGARRHEQPAAVDRRRLHARLRRPAADRGQPGRPLRSQGRARRSGWPSSASARCCRRSPPRPTDAHRHPLAHGRRRRADHAGARCRS